MESARWLAPEGRRYWISSAALVAAAALSFPVYEVFKISDDQGVWFSSLIGYSAFAAAHALTTWLAFRRLSGERFAATLARIAPPQSWRTRNGLFRVLTGSADGLSWSSQVAFFALIAVGTLTFMKETDSWVWAGPLTALTVVTAWVDVMLSFSVQYARVYHSEGGMQGGFNWSSQHLVIAEV